MLLYLKIKPNQRLDKIERVGNEWVVRVKAPAIDGKANDHLIEYLSEILEIPKSKFILKKGHTGRLKCLEIEAVEIYVNNRLEAASGSLHT